MDVLQAGKAHFVERGPYLKVYLQDHLAGAAGGEALARRAARNHAETPFGPRLRTIAREIAEDRRDLEAGARRLGFAPSQAKELAALAAERIGRLKGNGHVVSRSPLTVLVELEALSLGVRGKLALWRALEGAGLGEAAGVDLARLADRAEEQWRVLEEMRLEAARTVLR